MSRCPKCNSERVHRSHRRGVMERIAAVFGFKSRRCHACSARFVTMGNSALFRRDAEVILQKIALALLGALTITAVVLAVLWFSREREASAGAELAPSTRAFKGSSALRAG